jgi:hypothetical protein
MEKAAGSDENRRASCAEVGETPGQLLAVDAPLAVTVEPPDENADSRRRAPTMRTL